jgi:hypothetical protein
MARGAILVLVVLLSRPVSADIVAWQDAAGVRHYTNLAALVPEAYRNVARVVVDEAARQGAEPAPAETERPDDAGVRSDRMQATTALDREALAQAYLAGLQRGLTAEDLQNRAPSVVFNGPQAVAVTAPSEAPTVYAAWEPSVPLVTTSFDRGRSRHLTLRLLLQDQFALDRDGPYAYIERLPPLGVNLAPFLPRGLPFGPGRYGRVIVR